MSGRLLSYFRTRWMTLSGYRYASDFHSFQNHSCGCSRDVGCTIIYVQSWNHIADCSKHYVPVGPAAVAVPGVVAVLAVPDARAFLVALGVAAPAAPVVAAAAVAVLGVEADAAVVFARVLVVVGTVAVAAVVVAADKGSLRFAALRSDRSYQCPRSFHGYYCFAHRSSAV